MVVEHVTQSRAGVSALRERLGRSQMYAVADEVLRAGPGVEVLRRRHDAMVVRCPWPEVGSIIVKLWDRRGFARTLRRLTRTSSVMREWRVMRRLAAHGVSVPEPLGYCRLPSHAHSFTDALFMKDLGACVIATEHVKELIRDGQERQLRAFEDAIIDLTCSILRAGVVDTDHSMVNIVVPPAGVPVRLDLELARLMPLPWAARHSRGLMLGMLVGTYVFAVQPEVERAVAFAARLARQSGASRGVLAVARRRVSYMLELQRREAGLDTQVVLPW